MMSFHLLQLYSITYSQFSGCILDSYLGSEQSLFGLNQAEFIYLLSCSSLDLESLPSWSPKRTASASSIVVSVVAPRNLDVSSRSRSRSRTLVPLWYFLNSKKNISLILQVTHDPTENEIQILIFIFIGSSFESSHWYVSNSFIWWPGISEFST